MIPATVTTLVLSPLFDSQLPRQQCNTRHASSAARRVLATRTPEVRYEYSQKLSRNITYDVPDESEHRRRAAVRYGARENGAPCPAEDCKEC